MNEGTRTNRFPFRIVVWCVGGSIVVLVLCVLIPLVSHGSVWNNAGFNTCSLPVDSETLERLIRLQPLEDRGDSYIAMLQFLEKREEIRIQLLSLVVGGLGILVAFLTLIAIKRQLNAGVELNQLTATAALLEHIGDTRAYYVQTGQFYRLRDIDSMLEEIQKAIGKGGDSRRFQTKAFREALQSVVRLETGR